ncbi:hypothetical protein J6590_029177 [Homalodisca vitripennis]|nr:hypothetical protein J6590_029177 [Homalodisca vitripennis]
MSRNFVEVFVLICFHMLTETATQRLRIGPNKGIPLFPGKASSIDCSGGIITFRGERAVSVFEGTQAAHLHPKTTIGSFWEESRKRVTGPLSFYRAGQVLPTGSSPPSHRPSHPGVSGTCGVAGNKFLSFHSNPLELISRDDQMIHSDLERLTNFDQNKEKTSFRHVRTIKRGAVRVSWCNGIILSVHIPFAWEPPMVRVSLIAAISLLR